MSLDIIYNGEFFPEDKPILAVNNRAFRYGDGLFESIRVVDGKVYNFEGHYQRLLDGMKAFRFLTPEFYSLEFFLNQIDSFLF